MTEATPRKISDAAAKVVDHVLELGRITDEPGMLTRTFLSPAMHQANELVTRWMLEAGLTVSEDDWGNIIGRLPSSNPRAKALLLGSHLDTVRNAGRYDGPLGFLLGVATAEELQRTGYSLPFHLDVIGFSDEEGVRFYSTYLGSKAIAGLITEDDMKLADQTGLILAQAVGNTGILPKPRYNKGELLGYIEAHIEQGPVLEAGGHALGVVTAIAAQSRYTCVITGRSGHAGTTPMNLRQDALAGAAEFISFVEKIGRETPGLVATVGQLKVEPNVSNVIATSAVMSLDVRHAQTSVAAATLERLMEEGRQLAKRRQLIFNAMRVQVTDSVECDRSLTATLAQAVGKTQAEVPHLTSGAGHDGVILSRIAPIAMLFVRCQKGLSHHPEEHVEPADIEAALEAMVNCIRELKW